MKHAFRVLISASIIVLLSGCYAVQKSDSYYGVKTSNQNVVFLLDRSGSMEGKDEGIAGVAVQSQVLNRSADVAQDKVGGFLGNLIGGQIRSEGTKMGAAKRALIPAVRGLETPSRYAVVTFGGQVDTWHGQMTPATASSKNVDIVRINQVSAEGGTPMLTALQRGFQYPDATVIFLLTDGQPTDSNNADILARVAALNSTRRVVIHTIGFGDDKDTAFLRRLAQDNGGQYIDQTNAGNWLPF